MGKTAEEQHGGEKPRKTRVRRRCKQSSLENQGCGSEPSSLIVKCVCPVFPAQSLGEQHHNNEGALLHSHLSFLLSNPSCLITRAQLRVRASS